ncbi:hypothetical protein RIF29_30196 [Crotalaria pallida]|uniref:Uncharacterized protein n=1 Tax=Crotalaria pallida TaxID=3830 RepID=A0AAN9EGD6_CROPI
MVELLMELLIIAQGLNREVMESEQYLNFCMEANDDVADRVENMLIDADVVEVPKTTQSEFADYSNNFARNEPFRNRKICKYGSHSKKRPYNLLYAIAWGLIHGMNSYWALSLLGWIALVFVWSMKKSGAVDLNFLEIESVTDPSLPSVWFLASGNGRTLQMTALPNGNVDIV